MVVRLVPELPLNSYCEAHDICADDNAACRNLTCLCKDGYFEKSSVCCKFPTFSVADAWLLIGNEFELALVTTHGCLL